MNFLFQALAPNLKRRPLLPGLGQLPKGPRCLLCLNEVLDFLRETAEISPSKVKWIVVMAIINLTNSWGAVLTGCATSALLLKAKMEVNL